MRETAKGAVRHLHALLDHVPGGHAAIVDQSGRHACDRGGGEMSPADTEKRRIPTCCCASHRVVARLGAAVDVLCRLVRRKIQRVAGPAGGGHSEPQSQSMSDSTATYPAPIAIAVAPLYNPATPSRRSTAVMARTRELWSCTQDS